MDFEKINIFGKGNPNDEYAEYFDGHSYLNPLVGKDGPLYLANVTFEPGCRNHWHVHRSEEGGGQILLCTAGHGVYQEWGKEPVQLAPGDVIVIRPGVKHWHGATPGSWFSHVSIEVPGKATSTQWLEPVDADFYAKLG